MLANAVKSLSPSPKVGVTGAPKVGLSCDIFKNFTSCGVHCAEVCCASGPETVLFYTRGGPLADGILSLGQTPTLLPLGPPGPPTAEKVFPQFLKILRGQGQNFDCVIRGPQRGICGEILVTVPWPISPEKKSKILTNNVFFSSYRNFPRRKNIERLSPL